MLTQKSKLGLLTPRRFTQTARWRFNRDRRACYLRRVGDPPDEYQALLILQLIAAEWHALYWESEAADADAPLAPMRLAAEFRRQLLKLDRVLGETLAATTPQEARPPTVAEIMAASR